jgi:RNA polymerase sigma-70 factor (ECF subfamily)
VVPERRREVNSQEPRNPVSDEERFRVIFQIRYPSIHSYVLRRLGSSSGEISDVTAQVFHVAWRRLSHLPDPPDDLPWLYGVARKLVYRHWRTTRRRQQLEVRLTHEATISGDNSTSDTNPDVDPVRTALSRLRPADQELLKLIHWEQLTRAEAGQVLGCSANAVSVRLHKARQRLGHQLAEDAPQRDDRPPGGPSHGS